MPLHDLRIILIDDDDVDTEAVARILRQHGADGLLTTFSNAVLAQQALAGPLGQALLGTPYVILLDINMPRLNGLEFLAWLRTQPDLDRSVVFILTTSVLTTDIQHAYDLQVAGYLHKEHTGPGYSALADLLVCYARYNAFPPTPRQRRPVTAPLDPVAPPQRAKAAAAPGLRSDGTQPPLNLPPLSHRPLRLSSAQCCNLPCDNPPASAPTSESLTAYAHLRQSPPGSVTRNRLPAPGVLSTVTVPPIAATLRCT